MTLTGLPVDVTRRYSNLPEGVQKLSRRYYIDRAATSLVAACVRMLVPSVKIKIKS